MAQQEDLFKKVIAHCKEYGFVFPSSEIYDGLGAVYDYGQLGSELKNNIKRYWWEAMTLLAPNVVGIDSAIFMHPKIWKASGHVDAFNDPLIDNKDSKKRYRADVLIEHVENAIDRMQAAIPELKSFVIPGGSRSASTAHVCRTVCRRAERLIIALDESSEVDRNLMAYVNRLSDYFFVLSRYLNNIEKVDEKIWQNPCK